MWPWRRKQPAPQPPPAPARPPHPHQHVEERDELQKETHSSWLADACHEYEYEELMRATNNWSPTHKLGQGSSGSVYGGVLETGPDVAIKVIDLQSLYDSGFNQEVKVLSKLRHPHLVLLMGWAQNGDKRFLVYERLSMDLQQRMANSSIPYPWKDRLKNLFECAQALAHLHKSKPKIFHRDIKTPNILLDSAGRAKLADFGLACATSEHSIQHVITKGTPGYADPQYQQTHYYGEHTEMYAFGMVLLEILIARPPARVAPRPRAPPILLRDEMNIFNKEEVMQTVDQRAGWPPAVASQVYDLVTQCIADDFSQRLSALAVLRELRTLLHADPNGGPEAPLGIPSTSMTSFGQMVAGNPSASASMSMAPNGSPSNRNPPMGVGPGMPLPFNPQAQQQQPLFPHAQGSPHGQGGGVAFFVPHSGATPQMHPGRPVPGHSMIPSPHHEGAHSPTGQAQASGAFRPPFPPGAYPQHSPHAHYQQQAQMAAQQGRPSNPQVPFLTGDRGGHGQPGPGVPPGPFVARGPVVPAGGGMPLQRSDTGGRSRRSSGSGVSRPTGEALMKRLRQSNPFRPGGARGPQSADDPPLFTLTLVGKEALNVPPEARTIYGPPLSLIARACRHQKENVERLIAQQQQREGGEGQQQQQNQRWPPPEVYRPDSIDFGRITELFVEVYEPYLLSDDPLITDPRDSVATEGGGVAGNAEFRRAGSASSSSSSISAPSFLTKKEAFAQWYNTISRIHASIDLLPVPAEFCDVKHRPSGQFFTIPGIHSYCYIPVLHVRGSGGVVITGTYYPVNSCKELDNRDLVALAFEPEHPEQITQSPAGEHRTSVKVKRTHFVFSFLSDVMVDRGERVSPPPGAPLMPDPSEADSFTEDGRPQPNAFQAFFQGLFGMDSGTKEKKNSPKREAKKAKKKEKGGGSPAKGAKATEKGGEGGDGEKAKDKDSKRGPADQKPGRANGDAGSSPLSGQQNKPRSSEDAQEAPSRARQIAAATGVRSSVSPERHQGDPDALDLSEGDCYLRSPGGVGGGKGTERGGQQRDGPIPLPRLPSTSERDRIGSADLDNLSLSGLLSSIGGNSAGGNRLSTASGVAGALGGEGEGTPGLGFSISVPVASRPSVGAHSGTPASISETSPSGRSKHAPQANTGVQPRVASGLGDSIVPPPESDGSEDVVVRSGGWTSPPEAVGGGTEGGGEEQPEDDDVGLRMAAGLPWRMHSNETLIHPGFDPEADGLARVADIPNASRMEPIGEEGEEDEDGYGGGSVVGGGGRSPPPATHLQSSEAGSTRRLQPVNSAGTSGGARSSGSPQGGRASEAPGPFPQSPDFPATATAGGRTSSAKTTGSPEAAIGFGFDPGRTSVASRGPGPAGRFSQAAAGGWSSGQSDPGAPPATVSVFPDGGQRLGTGSRPGTRSDRRLPSPGGSWATEPAGGGKTSPLCLSPASRESPTARAYAEAGGFGGVANGQRVSETSPSVIMSQEEPVEGPGVQKTGSTVAGMEGGGSRSGEIGGEVRNVPGGPPRSSAGASSSVLPPWAGDLFDRTGEEEEMEEDALALAVDQHSGGDEQRDLSVRSFEVGMLGDRRMFDDDSPQSRHSTASMKAPTTGGGSSPQHKGGNRGGRGVTGRHRVWDS
uniref:Protein kinase domain-containing protein n=1 Tax=Chromera velia CCMP2878 TaxID=1169474 RepID=A0A0G4I3N9_9ALVE|eukprot:Cvel_10647.t1-p1 / transcript=Cvel_10647.t1 / gene=Cvel_10647 / organism=Chromera_velia_CCMP2878 / gene_product=Proline-rich receptor-like protein kinase PERK14, putative / transcript_product=Proline-rich receptor-like protein kinase PERK14, putative / location=Cvel_scaffold647:14615-21241(+) / protein_length=1626 / sequence_SO=supercontig / SO=protein_coding / is_pseudo=false